MLYIFNTFNKHKYFFKIFKQRKNISIATYFSLSTFGAAKCDIRFFFITASRLRFCHRIRNMFQPKFLSTYKTNHHRQ